MPDRLDRKRQSQDHDAEAQHGADAEFEPFLVALGHADRVANDESENDGDGNGTDWAFAALEVQPLTDHFGKHVSRPRERERQYRARQDRANPSERLMR